MGFLRPLLATAVIAMQLAGVTDDQLLAQEPRPDTLVAGDLLEVLPMILNVREGAGLHYPVIDQLEKGKIVCFIRRTGEWLLVKYLVTSPEADSTAFSEGHVARGFVARLREEPETQERDAGGSHPPWCEEVRSRGPDTGP